MWKPKRLYSIYLPKSKIPVYLDVALKALTLHAEARTTFKTYALSLLRSSYSMNLACKYHFFHRARVLSFQTYSFLIYLRRHPPIKRTYDGQLGDTVKHLRALDCLCACDHTNIGCRLYSSTNTSPDSRFVAQASYERAAQMRVSPAPDVLTRIFMLFRGVRSRDCGGRGDVLDEGRWR